MSALFLAGASFAQSGGIPAPNASFIDLEGRGVLAQSKSSGSAQFRFFNGREGLTYSGVEGRTGLGSGFEGILRGTLARTKSDTLTGGTLTYGGNEIEAALRYEPESSKGCSLMAGVAFANTPAQSRPLATLGASYRAGMGGNTVFDFNPKAILIKQNALIGLGIGLSFEASPGITFSAEATPLIGGENTRDANTGERMRRTLYGAAIHYTPQGGAFTLSAGYTNSTGASTGASLTPGLGNSGALFLGICGRFQ